MQKASVIIELNLRVPPTLRCLIINYRVVAFNKIRYREKTRIGTAVINAFHINAKALRNCLQGAGFCIVILRVWFKGGKNQFFAEIQENERLLHFSLNIRL